MKARRLYKSSNHIWEIWLCPALMFGLELGPPHSFWIGPIEIAWWNWNDPSRVSVD